MTGRKAQTGEEPRALLERPVALRFRHLGKFSDELAANVSTGGMFIRTRTPHPVGSVFEFQLNLGDDQSALAGKAQVAWVRRRSQGADAPSGMGVRFVELADESRRRIGQLVAAQEQKSGKPLAVEPGEPPPEAPPRAAAAEADQPARDAAAADPAAGPVTVAAPPAAAPLTAPEGRAMSAQTGRRRRLPWILLAAALLAAITAALWPRAASTPAPAATGAAPDTPRAAPGERTSPTANKLAAKPAQLQLVDDWSRAWSDQRVEAYLDAYSPRFTPPQGLDRAAWERQRRARILTSQWIAVDVALIELEEIDAQHSRVRFVQAYDSDSYRDVVRKTLDLERTDGAWKIVRETVEP